MHYHQADYLTEELKENNFEIINLQHQDYPTQDGVKTTDLIMIARKQNSTQDIRILENVVY